MSVYVRMRVGGDQFALPVEHVREIARLGDVSPVPGAGEVVLGVRNLRGQVLPVFDLAALLGVAGSGRPSRVVVAEAGGHRAGLAIDAVTDVAELGDDVTVIDVPRLFASLREGASE